MALTVLPFRVAATLWDLGPGLGPKRKVRAQQSGDPTGGPKAGLGKRDHHLPHLSARNLLPVWIELAAREDVKDRVGVVLGRSPEHDQSQPGYTDSLKGERERPHVARLLPVVGQSRLLGGRVDAQVLVPP